MTRCTGSEKRLEYQLLWLFPNCGIGHAARLPDPFLSPGCISRNGSKSRSMISYTILDEHYGKIKNGRRSTKMANSTRQANQEQKGEIQRFAEIASSFWGNKS